MSGRTPPWLLVVIPRCLLSSSFCSGQQCQVRQLTVCTLLENLTDDAMALAVCDEIFDPFPRFEETLRHIEVFNSVISQKTRNPPKLF